MTTLTVLIPGVPQQQGSKKHVGRGIMIEANQRLAPWRADAIAAIRAAMGPDWTPLDGPLHLKARFIFARPVSHYGTGRNTGQLKPSAPLWKTTAPDLDKLLRAVDDALTQAGAWRDDARLVAVNSTKMWGDYPHTVLTVRTLR